MKNINGKTNLIPRVQDKLNNLPDDSAVMDLFRQLDPAFVSKVMGLAAGAKDAIDSLESQREGVDEFMNVGVNPMRADLKTVLADAKTLADAAQRVRYMRNADANRVPIDGTVGNDVIDRRPPVVLFALGKVLDSANPSGASKLDDVIVKLPEEFTSSDSNICEELRNNFEATRCEILRRPAFQSRRLTDISNVASGAADLLRSIKHFAPEEVVVHVAVVAVGGGGANIRLPIHGAIEPAAILLDKISRGMDRMTDRQDECSAADEKMERDMLSCTALASYDADISRVLDLAQRRLDSLGQSSEANGLG